MSAYRKLMITDLSVDPTYQRELSPMRVNKMGADWQPAMVGTLEVSDRGGQYVVFDGQHRMAAATIAGVRELPAIVHQGLTQEQEAELFARLQRERKPLSRFEQFRAKLVARNADALAIDKIVRDAGYTISGTRHSGPDKIVAVASLERVYADHGGEGLRSTLDLIGRAWDGDEGSFIGQMIEGVALVIRTHGTRITDAHVKRLGAVAPRVVLRRAANHVNGTGAISYATVAAEIRKTMRLRPIATTSKENES